MSAKVKKVLKNRKVPQFELKKGIYPPVNWGLYPDSGAKKHGLSQSLIQKFVVCRERFRLRTVEGLSSREKKDAMEFGTIFHKALELAAQGKTTSQIFAFFHRKVKDKTYDPLLCRIASVMVPYYRNWWKDELKEVQYVETEQVFELPYKCMGKTIMLRGRRDEAFIRDGLLWLQENKTKSQILEDQIQMTLGYMIQPMMYLLSIKAEQPNVPLGGICYNVIRKPQLKQNKKESESQYLDRIVEDIETRPEHYFKMFEVNIDDAHLEMWRLRYFHPLISQIVMWWESIKHDPFEPWTTPDPRVVDWAGLSEDRKKENLIPNPHHYLRPFGVFDPMSHGLGEYYNLVVNGLDVGLERDVEVFQELKDEFADPISEKVTKDETKTKEQRKKGKVRVVKKAGRR